MEDDHVVRFSKYAGMMNFVWMSLAWPPVQIMSCFLTVHSLYKHPQTCFLMWKALLWFTQALQSHSLRCCGPGKCSFLSSFLTQFDVLLAGSWSLLLGQQIAVHVLTQSILRYVNKAAGHHDDHPGHVPHWGAVDQEAEVPTHPLLMNWRLDALLPAISIPMNFPLIEVNPASRSLPSN
jgi:hypothetical protein